MVLDDEQVAALAVGTDHIAHLAVEVQAHRQRRCGNCWHGTRDHPLCDGVGVMCLSTGVTQRVVVMPDWFCADFSAKGAV